MRTEKLKILYVWLTVHAQSINKCNELTNERSEICVLNETIFP